MKKQLCLWSCILMMGTAALFAGEPAAAPKPDFSIRVSTDKNVAIYQSGEKMEFTLKVFKGDTPVAGNKIKWKRTGDDGVTEEGEGTADAAGLKVVTKTDKPGFVRLQAWAFGEDGKNLQGFVGGWGANKHGNIFFDGGACAEPEKLASIDEPADFDDFWKKMKEELAAVPLKADLKEIEYKNKKVKVYAVSITCAGPRPVTGYLSIPVNAKEKSQKAVLSFHGYGNGKHNPPGWLGEWAIVFDVNAHGMELGRDDEYYKQFQQSTSGYAFNNTENADPKKAYFYGMAMRLLRAFEYVKTLKEWNGKDLASNGGSQGGLQGLWGAALEPAVTSADIWSPWCCDLGGITVQRQRGWRPDYQKALDYYDPAFMAKRIKSAKINLIANYGDYTCPPSSVWIVYNNLATPNKRMVVKQGCTHNYEMPQRQCYTLTPDGPKDIFTSK